MSSSRRASKVCSTCDEFQGCRQRVVTTLSRYGHVDETAALLSFVAAPEFSYITGANLTVDVETNA